jgi:hypothetical protein
LETKTFDKAPVQNFETIGCACSLGAIDGKKDCCKKYKKKGKFCGGCPKK